MGLKNKYEINRNYPLSGKKSNTYFWSGSDLEIRHHSFCSLSWLNGDSLAWIIVFFTYFSHSIAKSALLTFYRIVMPRSTIFILSTD